MLEWIAYFVSRVVSARWSDCGAKNGKTRHHVGIAGRAFGSLQRSPAPSSKMALLAPFWGDNYPKTQASAPFASKKVTQTVVYATQLIYTCTIPIRYNHAYTNYTRQPKVPNALTGGGRRHLGALHPKDNKRQDKTRQGKNLDRWSVRKLFSPSWPTLAIGRTPHTGK